MNRKLFCSLGIHKYMDLWRRDETAGQDAIEECIHCGKSGSVFRLFWRKDGPMHPRLAEGQK